MGVDGRVNASENGVASDVVAVSRGHQGNGTLLPGELVFGKGCWLGGLGLSFSDGEVCGRGGSRATRGGGLGVGSNGGGSGGNLSGLGPVKGGQVSGDGDVGPLLTLEGAYKGGQGINFAHGGQDVSGLHLHGFVNCDLKGDEVDFRGCDLDVLVVGIAVVVEVVVHQVGSGGLHRGGVN